MSEAMATISIPLEADAYDRLKRAAAEIGMPVEAFIASAAERVAARRLDLHHRRAPRRPAVRRRGACRSPRSGGA